MSDSVGAIGGGDDGSSSILDMQKKVFDQQVSCLGLGDDDSGGGDDSSGGGIASSALGPQQPG